MLEQPVTEVGGIPTPVQMTVEAIVSAAERGDTAALVDLADAEKLGFFESNCCDCCFDDPNIAWSQSGLDPSRFAELLTASSPDEQEKEDGSTSYLWQYDGVYAVIQEGGEWTAGATVG